MPVRERPRASFLACEHLRVAAPPVATGIPGGTKASQRLAHVANAGHSGPLLGAGTQGALRKGVKRSTCRT